MYLLSDLNFQVNLGLVNLYSQADFCESVQFTVCDSFSYSLFKYFLGIMMMNIKL